MPGLLLSQKWTANIEFNYSQGDGTIRYQKSFVENDQRSFGMKASYGVTLKERLFVGIGLGIERFAPKIGRHGEERKVFMPITVEGRWKILKSRVSPIATYSGGYPAGVENITGKWVSNPSVGLIYPWGKKLSHFITVGYKWNRCEAYFYQPWVAKYYGSNDMPDKKPVEYSIHRFITLTTGFTF